jgi:hypothetical protein
MPEKKIKIPFPMPDSPLFDAAEVQIKESTERWSDVQLEDGTVLRVRPSILGAVRVDGQYDQDGNPAYTVKAQLQIVVASTPDTLRKGGTDAKIN